MLDRVGDIKSRIHKRILSVSKPLKFHTIVIWVSAYFTLLQAKSGI